MIDFSSELLDRTKGQVVTAWNHRRIWVRMGLDVENRLLQATSTLAECMITGIFRVNSAVGHF